MERGVHRFCSEVWALSDCAACGMKQSSPRGFWIASPYSYRRRYLIRADARADGAGDAGAAEATIASRVLGEILLMIILSEIERTGIHDLGCGRGEAVFCQLLAIGLARGL